MKKICFLKKRKVFKQKSKARRMHPLGLGFSIFWVFGFGYCKSLANFEIGNLKYKKKILVFGHEFEYKF